MTLAEFWFILIAFTFVSYFVLEGFDFGVGMLLPILGKDDTGRRVMINTIGPVWDANETWLVLAAGAMFAAFPYWYASGFSAFYLPLLVILAALIVRGVAFEFRGKVDDPQWRARWDICIVVGSIVIPFLWGVFFANLVHGLPLNSNGDYVGTVLGLFSPFAVLGGVAIVAIFLAHGAVFISLRTRGGIRHDASALAGTLGLVAVVIVAVFLAWMISIRGDTLTAVLAAIVVAALLGALVCNRRGREGWAFGLTAGSILLLVSTYFTALYPNVMPSTIDPAYTLTIANASSSSYTLTLMSWMAIIIVPFVLAYQAWSYWVFRNRLSRDSIPSKPQHGASNAGAVESVAQDAVEGATT
jgi:cytochrome d ubiquinol oxidase subunit II